MITDTLIRSLLPNTFAYGIGDTTLLDRIRPHIPQAEYFIYSELCPARLLAPYRQAEEEEEPSTLPPSPLTLQPVTALTDRITAAHALWSAIPALDITLSPTGFAVGSTDSLQPASANRVKELRAAILSIRDTAILEFLRILPAIPGWLDTPHAGIHTQSILTPGELSDIMTPGQPFSYSSYKRTLTPAVSAQTTLAGTWLSIPLTMRLAAVALIERTFPRPMIAAAIDDSEPALPDTATAVISLLLPGITSERWLALRTILEPARRWLRQRVSEAIGTPLPSPSTLTGNGGAPAPAHRSTLNPDSEILDTVTWIRDHPEFYPEWHTSATALRFAHKPFVNEKRSGGYFF